MKPECFSYFASLLSLSGMHTREFRKENGTWFINLNAGSGDVMQKIPLRKGADQGLDMMANGKPYIHITYDTKPFEGADVLVLIKVRDRADGGGGYYLLKTYKRREINLELVLNAAIEYVFGKVPEVIYFRQEEEGL
jgi:hypothetical protein